MPTHWLGASLRPRKATENRPVKMITAPRSIWKLEALVMFRASKGKTRLMTVKCKGWLPPSSSGSRDKTSLLTKPWMCTCEDSGGVVGWGGVLIH